jgi:signal transduction histidine kinase
MNFSGMQALRRLSNLLATRAPDPAQQALRIDAMERRIVLPVKAAVILILSYYLYFSFWFDEITGPRELAFEFVRDYFLIYLIFNIAAALLLLGMRQLPIHLVHWLVFTIALVDGIFLAALSLIAGGLDSPLYWIFLGLILRNAISMALPTSQVVLNLSISLCYLGAGLADISMGDIEREAAQQAAYEQRLSRSRRGEAQAPGETALPSQRFLPAPAPTPVTTDVPENPTESLLLRLIMMWQLTLVCGIVQILFDKQRQYEEKSREYAVRQQQLEATSRLAAEISHQIKNPLAIINNAAYTIQRLLKGEAGIIADQLQIIREEIERSDKIITEIMGYSKLAGGQVERLEVPDEIERAITQVFPPAADYQVRLHRDYAPALPSLLMQRSQLEEIFVNLLQNAREAMHGEGDIWIRARYGDQYSVTVTLTDNGPGIPPDKREQIFEAYFTTKVKGSGLGLAIVKHNVEIYGGSVRLESELGKGTTFTLQFPARTVLKLRK